MNKKKLADAMSEVDGALFTAIMALIGTGYFKQNKDNITWTYKKNDPKVTSIMDRLVQLHCDVISYNNSNECKK